MFDDGLLEMRWRDALFLHWPVSPETVAERLPERLSVATYDGDAYLGVVAFVMEDIRVRGLPFGLSFPELNLRTYADGPHGRGVYFFSLDAADPIGVHVARRLFALPYYRAEMSVRTEASTTDGDSGHRVHFTSHRIHRGAPPVHFDATYEPTGSLTRSRAESLSEFLTENYRFYAAGRHLYRGEIHHEPWPLQPATAEVRTNTLFAASDFDRPAGDPLIHYSPDITVNANLICRV